MTIVTIQNKSLIRYLPSGQRAEPVGFCHSPSLVRVDSSRILMTYLACTASAQSKICACYLDEEFVVDASSNVVLSAGFERSESFSLYQDGQEITGLCDESSEVARFNFDRRPETEIEYLYDRPRGRLVLFTLNGSLMVMSGLLPDFCLLQSDRHGYACYTLLKHETSENVLPGAVSGLVKSGDGWVFFYFIRLIPVEIRFFMVRMKFDGSFSFEFTRQPAIAIPNLSELGTPMRHGEGWALPFDDGSGVCKIALIADSEIEPTLPNAPEPS